MSNKSDSSLNTIAGISNKGKDGIVEPERSTYSEGLLDSCRSSQNVDSCSIPVIPFPGDQECFGSVIPSNIEIASIDSQNDETDSHEDPIGGIGDPAATDKDVSLRFEGASSVSTGFTMPPIGSSYDSIPSLWPSMGAMSKGKEACFRKGKWTVRILLYNFIYFCSISVIWYLLITMIIG